jgi:hypothetical protein
VPPEHEKRRRPRRKPFGTQSELTINGEAVKLIDCSNNGLRVESRVPLSVGTLVLVDGEIHNTVGHYPAHGHWRVRWCSQLASNSHIAGLSLESAADHAAAEPSKAPDTDIDYYDVLQVSRKADAETIRRVFHLLAQRYHPDNQETGNEELFRHVVRAQDVLCDPERRAAYDVQLAAQDHVRFRVFENWQNSRGVHAEVRKRQGILRLLYSKRVTDPGQPGIYLREFEDLLGCPREHLEFSFWVLRENKLITRADNSRYEITYQGVAAVEAEDVHSAAPAPYPMLPAPAETVKV